MFKWLLLQVKFLNIKKIILRIIILKYFAKIQILHNKMWFYTFFILSPERESYLEYALFIKYHRIL